MDKLILWPIIITLTFTCFYILTQRICELIWGKTVLLSTYLVDLRKFSEALQKLPVSREIFDWNGLSGKKKENVVLCKIWIQNRTTEGQWKHNDLEHMCQALTYIRGFIYVTEVTYQFLFFRNNYLNFTTSAHHIIFSLWIFNKPPHINTA